MTVSVKELTDIYVQEAATNKRKRLQHAYVHRVSGYIVYKYTLCSLYIHWVYI